MKCWDNLPAFFCQGNAEGFGLCDFYVPGEVESPGMLLLLAAVRDRSWRGCFCDEGPASHELNELPPSLSAVTALLLGGTALRDS